MDLRGRLARLDRLTRKPESVDPLTLPDTGAASGPDALGLEDAGDGTWRGHAVLDVPPPGELPPLAGLVPDHWPALEAPADLLFLDTETTGLAGGTGTLAFLVGLAWWADDGLHVEQRFLPGPGAEPALLAAVAGAAAGRRVVVSYNGAGFDWPLLRTRALLNRRDDPLAELAGWDLLVPARRLWSRALPDCRQQTIEAEVCGRRRGPGDIPGDQIPQAWFDFLAGRDDGALRRVITHNRRDMEGMARALLAVLEAAGRIGSPPAGPAEDWRLAWALGRACEKRRADAPAGGWMRAAAAGGADATDLRFVADAVRLLKRSGDYHGALDLIARALEAAPGTTWLHREAAVIWEHRLGDAHRALAHAAEEGDARRLERLERRARQARAKEAS